MNPSLIVVPILAAAGAGIAAWGAMSPRAQLYGPTIRSTGRSNTLALTFDDGPNPAVTPRLLALLEQYGIRATFFLIGRFVRACPDLAREISARGHTIGNHTDTHPNLFWLSRARLCEELGRCQQALAETIGRVPRWMRPPFGIRHPRLDRVAREQGLQGVVMWTLIGKDWIPQPPERLIERLRAVHGGDIVTLHDGDHHGLGGDRLRTVDALAYWLPRWRDAGLEFVTIDAVGNGAAGDGPAT